MIFYRKLLSALQAKYVSFTLRSKITVALIASVTVVCGLVMAASYASTYYLIINYTHQLLNSKAELDQRALEIRLSGEIQLAMEVANNFMTANALADTVESELYLVPYLKNQNHTFTGTGLSVVDYRGRAIASNLDKKPDYSGNAVFNTMMQTGQVQIRLGQVIGHDASLLLILPVRYRLTNEVEGGVILDIPLTSLLPQNTKNNYHWLVDATGSLVVGQKPHLDNVIVSAGHEVRLPIGNVNLEYYLAQDRNVALSEIDTLLVGYLGISLIAIFGLLILAKVSARAISGPLEHLTEVAQQITGSGRIESRINIQSGDEYGALAKAFNTMLERLSNTYDDLEARVNQRTIEHETAKLQAEKARNLLQDAVSSITHGFGIYDQDDRLIVFNEAYRQYTQLGDFIAVGRTYEEILNRIIENRLFPDSIGREAEWVQERIAHHKKADKSLLELKRADGHWFMLQEVRSPSGHVIASRIDITEIKSVTEALREAELRWSLAMRGANDGVWDWNLRTDKVFYSDRWKTMLGYEQNDIKDDLEEWSSRLHPDDRVRTMEQLNAHLRGETEFYNVEIRMRCKDGSYKWILTRGKAFIDEDGKPVRITGSHTDISEKKIADAIIMDRTQQLDAIFALSPDGFVSFDQHHKFKYANPAFFNLTNLDVKMLAGLSEDEFSNLLAQQCKEDARFIGIAALRAKLAIATQNAGSKGVGNDVAEGQVIELASAGNRLLEISMRLSLAETVSEILYVRDVTYEVEVARIKSEFLSTAAHELRTPMSSIYGYSELLLARDFGAEQQREFHKIIHKQAALVSEILNELLDLQRIESRRGKDFIFARLDVAKLVNETIAMYKVPDGRAAPVVTMPDTSCFITADRSKMIQVINNVLSNAYKYSPDGGNVEVEVVDSANTADAAFIGIRVKDYGLGMTQQQLVHVFDRFYRADTSGSVPGTGLGMSIVKEVIELHHGHCDITSEPGVGTVVTLWLPANLNEAV